jgi:hypothetical protein
LKNSDTLKTKAQFLVSNGQTLVGKYVKHALINFCTSDNGVLDLIDFSFPQLEDATLSANFSCHFYFYKMITEDGKFSNLKQIPYPETQRAKINVNHINGV